MTPTNQPGGRMGILRIRNAIIATAKEFAKVEAITDANGVGWELGEPEASALFDAAMERREKLLNLLRELAEQLIALETHR